MCLGISDATLKQYTLTVLVWEDSSPSRGQSWLIQGSHVNSGPWEALMLAPHPLAPHCCEPGALVALRLCVLPLKSPLIATHHLSKSSLEVLGLGFVSWITPQTALAAAEALLSTPHGLRHNPIKRVTRCYGLLAPLTQQKAMELLLGALVLIGLS